MSEMRELDGTDFQVEFTPANRTVKCMSFSQSLEIFGFISVGKTDDLFLIDHCAEHIVSLLPV
ncbi:hypothetical protein [Bacillus haynesii]|uniref:hypothetical protein n=1 Tax=Bacillus haynesii TaxID=1925021 RepID=UPI002E101E5D